MENLTPLKKCAWFNSLPFKQINAALHLVERECPTCGAAIRFESGYPSLAVDSWIDLHYECGKAKQTFQNVGELPSSCGSQREFGNAVTAAYDFNLPIRFLWKGFQLFAEQFGLVLAKEIRVKTEPKADIYTDEKGNVFQFYANYADCPCKDQFQGIYLTFAPACSKVKL